MSLLLMQLLFFGVIQVLRNFSFKGCFEFLKKVASPFFFMQGCG